VLGEHERKGPIGRLADARRLRRQQAIAWVDDNHCWSCGALVCDQCGACTKAVCLTEDVPTVLRHVGPRATPQ